MVSNRNQPPDDSPIGSLTRTGEARIPTAHGDFTAYAYLDQQGREHLAYVAGSLNAGHTPLVRVHSECLTGDVLSSLRCDCGSQLARALEFIGTSEAGVLVYLRGHEGRGIGLGHKLQAYQLQDDGLDTVDANLELGFPVDGRDYGIAAAVLKDLGVTAARVLSNNPAKAAGLSDLGIEIVEQVPLIGTTTPDNVRYLETKRVRMEHALQPQEGH